MRKRTFDFTCPSCGHSFSMVRDTLLLKSSAGPAYERLQQNGFFLHQCQKCRQVFPLQYPLIYRDVQKEFALVLTDQKNVKNLPEGRTVLCRNARDFQFAFHCLDNGLDLEKMLRVQKAVSLQEGTEAELTGAIPEAETVIFRAGDRQVLIRLQR